MSGSPYREGGTLARLIAPDRRRLHAGLLIGLGLALGATLTAAAPRIADAFASEPHVEPTLRTFYVPISVRSAGDRDVDNHKPIPNALISRGPNQRAMTDANGLAYVRLQGFEGDLATISIACPPGFRSPKNITVPLKEVREEDGPLVVRCEVALQRVTIEITSEPNLPVLYMGRRIARTNASGVTSFPVEAAAGSHFAVTLDTTDRPDLTPVNPSREFVAGNTDETFVWTQSFAPATSEMGAITIVCIPKCDEIIDNDRSMGPGHIFNRPVRAGRHALKLAAPTGVIKNVVVDVQPSQTREVRVSMER